MNLFFRVYGYHFVHKIEKLPASMAKILPGMHHTGGNFKSSKQRSCPMPFVFMIKTPECFSNGHTQPPLLSFQRLKGRLLTVDNRIIGRVEIKTYDISRFRSEFRISTYTPTSATLQMDTVFTQYPPDMVIGDIAQTICQEPPRSGGISLRGTTIQSSQNTALGGLIIFLQTSPSWSIRKTGKLHKGTNNSGSQNSILFNTR